MFEVGFVGSIICDAKMNEAGRRAFGVGVSRISGAQLSEQMFGVERIRLVLSQCLIGSSAGHVRQPVRVWPNLARRGRTIIDESPMKFG
jgi:hypothetical protein